MGSVRQAISAEVRARVDAAIKERLGWLERKWELEFAADQLVLLWTESGFDHKSDL